MQNLLLSGLPAEILDRLRPHLRAQEFSLGQVMFSTGDHIDKIYFMTSGMVSLVIELSEGKMIETAIVGRDGVVGGSAALDDGQATYKALVQVQGLGHVLDIKTAAAVARENEKFRTALVRHEQMILAQAQQSAACNAAHDLPERLARWLLQIQDVTGRDTFSLTQEFIAEMLGVRRTSVSIVAHTLQAAGLISYRRGNIRILNLDGLRQAACECYNVTRSNYERLIAAPAKLLFTPMSGSGPTVPPST